MKKTKQIYSLITLASFILGIVLVSTNPKEKLKTLSGKEEVEYVENLERKRIKRRQMERAAKARRGELNPYSRPEVLIVPPKKNEPLTIGVCRGLFNIATILEGYGDVIDRKTIHSALIMNSKPVIEFFEKHSDPIVESIVDDIGDLEDVFVRSESDPQKADFYFDYVEIKERLLCRIHTFLELSCEKMSGSPNPFDVLFV